MINQFLSKSLTASQTRLARPVSRLPHRLLRLLHDLQPASLPASLKRVEEATTSVQLTRVTNAVQKQLWTLPHKEQIRWREKLIDALTTQVHFASTAALRIEAAKWLRLLVQTGLTAHPQKILETFVTAATRLDGSMPTEKKEQQCYLKLIFECFWAFRYPSPAFSWQLFPPNELFYPLAPLLNDASSELQEALLLIFAELPSLDDEEISTHLLSVALAWASNTDPERRRMAAHVLVHMSNESAQQALCQLQTDANPQVRASVKYATS